MSEYCEGCNDKCSPSQRGLNLDGSCPCTTCIVKMVCDTDGCERWAEWYDPESTIYYKEWMNNEKQKL